MYNYQFLEGLTHKITLWQKLPVFYFFNRIASSFKLFVVFHLNFMTFLEQNDLKPGILLNFLSLQDIFIFCKVNYLDRLSSLHCTLLVLFCVCFVQWSVFPLISYLQSARGYFQSLTIFCLRI